MLKKNISLLFIYLVIIATISLISFSCTPDYTTEPTTIDSTTVLIDTIKYIDLWTMQDDTLVAIDTTSSFYLYANCINDTGIVQDSTSVRFYSNIGSITSEALTTDGEAKALFSPFNSSGDLEAGNLTIIASSTITEIVSDTLKFYVKDGTGNNPPILSTSIPDLSVTEDFTMQSVTLSNYFTDPDGDDLTYTVSSYDSTQISCSLNGPVLMITSILNWNGSSKIEVRATENRSNKKRDMTSRSFVETSFKVIASAINDDPIIITSLPDTTFTEDFVPSALYLDLYFSDPDGDILSYSISNSNSSEISASINGSVLILNPIENWNGNTSLTIKAQDSQSKLFIEDTFEITISAVNDAPYLSNAIEDIDLDEDFAPIIIDLDNHFSDIDSGSSLSYNITSTDSSEITCLLDGSSLLITSILNWNGNSEVVVKCNDGFLSVETSFKVIVAPINDSPYIETLLPDTTLVMDFEPIIINLNNYFTDPDGQNLTYTYELENDTTFNIQLVDNIIVLTNKDSIIGSSLVTITADDLQSEKVSVQDTFNVSVTNP